MDNAGLAPVSISVPTDAVVVTRHFEFHMENRNEAVINKEQLLAHEDKLESQIPADRAQDLPYR